MDQILPQDHLPLLPAFCTVWNKILPLHPSGTVKIKFINSCQRTEYYGDNPTIGPPTPSSSCSNRNMRWKKTALKRVCPEVSCKHDDIVMVHWALNLKRVQPGETWCNLMEPDAIWCNLVQPDGTWWTLRQPGATWCYLMQPDATWYNLILPDATWCNLMQPDATWCNLMQPDATWCNLMQPDATWCNLMQPDVTWCNLG